MSGAFNGYHVWLGIPLAEQPPNHYRLLGVSLFETDGDVIEHAADRQMAHVRTFQSGRNGALSQQILNELAVARLCLLNLEKKRDYDHELRSKLTALPQAVPVGSLLPKAQLVAPVQPVAVGQSLAGKSGPIAAPRPVPAAKPPVATPKIELDTAATNDMELDLAPAAASLARSVSGTYQFRRRRRYRDSSWQRPAIMGFLAAVIVVSFMFLYSVLRGLDWKQVFEGLDSTMATQNESQGTAAPTASPPNAPSHR